MLRRGLLATARGSGSFRPAWISLATLTARLGAGLTKAAGNPVLARGAGGQWDSAEVRELHPVLDLNGLVVTESDGIWAYYGGYNGVTTGIGLAKSTDSGVTWTKYGSNPVVIPTGSGWYQNLIYQPTPVKLANGSRVMLATGRTGANADGIGCLTSTDGLTWADAGSKFTLASFLDGATAIAELGVPSMIHRSAGDWLMLCEARTTGVTAGWKIYGATASDPTSTWTVLNSGQPVFTVGTGWEAQGVANPNVIECTPGVYAMTYNGTPSPQEWKVGFASTSDFSTWTRYSGNPILSKGAAWDNEQTESGFLFKEPQSSSLRILYNGFRTSDDTAAAGLASTP